MLGKAPIRVIKIVAELPHGPQFLGYAQHYDRKAIDLTWVHLRPAPTQFEAELKALGQHVIGLRASSKLEWLGAWLRLVWLFLRKRPHVVHAELYPAGLLGLTSAWVCRVRKRILTRHHSTQSHIYFPKAVRTDKLVARMATRVLTVSENVRQVMLQREGVPAAKASVLWNTFDMARFRSVAPEKIAVLRQKYIPHSKGPVVGVIARWVDWKGIQYIVKAFEKLLASYPNAFLLLANAKGPDAPAIQAQLAALPPGSHTAIEYEPCVEGLYRLFDVYAHVPIDRTVEAFGQTYVEALAAGTPMVCTLSGIAPAFVVDGENALVVPYQDSDALHAALVRVLQDATLAAHLRAHGPPSVAGKFDLLPWVEKLSAIYAQ